MLTQIDNLQSQLQLSRTAYDDLSADYDKLLADYDVKNKESMDFFAKYTDVQAKLDAIKPPKDLSAIVGAGMTYDNTWGAEVLAGLAYKGLGAYVGVTHPISGPLTAFGFKVGAFYTF